MQYAASESPERWLNLTVESLDADAIIAWAIELNANKYPGLIADDNQGGWHGRPASYRLRVKFGVTEWHGIVCKLMSLGRTEYTLMLKPYLKGSEEIPSDIQTKTIVIKHSMSQLPDLLVAISIPGDHQESWVGANWFDSSLLLDVLQRQLGADRLCVWAVIGGYRFEVLKRSSAELVLKPYQTP